MRAALNVRKAREAVVALEGGLRAYDAAVTVAEARHAAGQMLKSDLLALHVLRAGTRESLGTARQRRLGAARLRAPLAGQGRLACAGRELYAGATGAGST